MDRIKIQSQMPSLVAGHIGRNVRAFKFRIFDGVPLRNTLGFVVDPLPFEGRVVVANDDAIVVKIKPSEFAVLDPALVTVVPREGAKVQVRPYARRRFDGLRADTPQERTEYSADGTPYTIKTHLLGSARIKLPLPEPQCPELAALIEQLEELRAPDGFRHLSHMLVDAGAQDFICVDPAPAQIIATPPSISFSVATATFAGRVTIYYDRGADTYGVTLERHGELVERCEDVHFDELGQALERLIDDGRWRRIEVSVVPAKVRAVATA